MRILMTLLAICSVSAANAQGSFQCNEHGAIVTIADGTVYYLGKNCDAAQKGDTHRILAEFVRPFQSHSQSPLVQ